MKCKKCTKPCIKRGFQTNGKERFYCKSCKASQQKTYKSKVYYSSVGASITAFLREGVGIRGISRLLKISTKTFMKKVLEISKLVARPHFSLVKNTKWMSFAHI
jgi:insertion element IS1 protein InsB